MRLNTWLPLFTCFQNDDLVLQCTRLLGLQSKVPQMWQLKTAEMYCLTVLEAGSPKPSCQQGCFLPKLRARVSSLPHFFWWLLTNLCVSWHNFITPISAFIFTGSFSLFVCFSFLPKDFSLNLRFILIHDDLIKKKKTSNLITSAKTISNKVIFTGVWVWIT